MRLQPQDIQVVEPLEAVSADTPRSQTRRTGSDANAQSAVLEILPDGVVNTIWRSRDELVFSVLPHDGKLLVFDRHQGPRSTRWTARSNVTLLLESTEEQTTRLLESGNRLYATSANIGKLFRIGDALATSGTYESNVKDTDSISSWGKTLVEIGRAAMPSRFRRRTGNTSTPDKTWSDWQTVDASGGTASPKARFIQWQRGSEIGSHARAAARLGESAISSTEFQAGNHQSGGFAFRRCACRKRR